MLFFRKGKFLALAASPFYTVTILPYFLLKENTHQNNYLLSLCIASLILSIVFFLRYRSLADIVTTRLRAAAQGYVEITGKGKLLADDVAGPGPYNLPVGLWFDTLQRRYATPFQLEDAYGQCTINPVDAEIITRKSDTYDEIWYEALYPGEILYVIGELVTRDAQNDVMDKRVDLNDLLSDWKRDQPFLKRNFDTNKNGKIDPDEWEQARKAANRLIDEKHAAHQQKKSTHIVQKSSFGRPFIITNIAPERLEQRYYFAMNAHLILSIVLLISLLVT